MTMCMLLDELDREAILVYLDATKVRVRIQQEVTIECADTITNEQAWHQFAMIDHHKDIKELVSPQLSEC